MGWVLRLVETGIDSPPRVIDVMGIRPLGDLGDIVALAGLLDERAQAQAHRTSLIETIGPDRVFRSVEEAVRKLGPNANLSNQS